MRNCRLLPQALSAPPQCNPGSPARRRSVHVLATVLLFVVAAGLTAPTTRLAHAAPFPDKPVRVIVPFPPGGSPDVVIRQIGARLTELWGQTVVVDDRPGAGGTIGTGIAAAANPDGYTMLMGNTPTQAIDVSLYRKIPYDPVKDFEPVILIGTTSPVLLVNPHVPATTLQQFIAYARKNPGKLLYGSAGNGTFSHLAMALLTTMAHIDLIHVPYRGNPAGLIDLAAGRVQAMFPTLPAALPQIKAGRARPVAIGSAKRSPLLPDVPTVSQAGVPGFDASLWYGLFVPAHTPRNIVDTLNHDLNKVLAEPGVRGALHNTGVDPVGGSPQALGRLEKSEIVKWRAVVKRSGAHID